MLGVYASAVHARWMGTDGKTIVKALAVASEPYIFWQGDKAESIIQKIVIPPELGNLSPANKQFNGPSGIALDDLILKPLGLQRADTWMCDLVPHSCVNPSQQKAIERSYLPVAQAFGLPQHNVPPVPSLLTDENRRREIQEELCKSHADVLILLGDKPIEWFLHYFDSRWKRLSDFEKNRNEYGRLHQVQIDHRKIFALPLAHPRQIARLGHSSKSWYETHQRWINESAKQLLGHS